MKIKRFDSTEKEHSFISRVSPNITKSQYYTVKTKTGFSIIIEPYLRFDDKTLLTHPKDIDHQTKEIVEVGSSLFSLLKNNLESNDEIFSHNIILCEVTPLINPEIRKADDVFLFSNDIFDAENFFKKMKYVSKKYKTSKYEILNITPRRNTNTEVDENVFINDIDKLTLSNSKNSKSNKEYEFYEIDENTKIHFTNTKPFDLYGYEKYEKNIQEKIYSTLFNRDDLESHKLNLQNIVVLKGKQDVRSEELSCQVAKKFKINSIVIDFGIKILSNNKKRENENSCKNIIMQIENNSSFGKTIIVLKNCFEKSVVQFDSICDFVDRNKELTYFFIVNTNEEAEKIVKYFSKSKSESSNDLEAENIKSKSINDEIEKLRNNDVEIFDIQMPLINDIGLLKNIINCFKNDMNPYQIREIFKLCKGYKINAFEGIIRDTISRILFKSKNSDNKYTIGYYDLLEIIKEKINEKKKDSQRVGFFKRILKKMFLKK